jgi:hypothetical protein
MGEDRGEGKKRRLLFPLAHTLSPDGKGYFLEIGIEQ